MTKIKINGRVYDKNTNETLQGANVSLQENFTTTNKLGSFTLEVEENDLDFENPNIKITKEGLTPTIKPILTQNNQIKTNLGAIGLINPKQKSKQEVSKLKNQVNQNVNKAFDLTLEPHEKVLVAQRKMVSSQISKVQNQVFPLLMQVLISFGIDKDGNQSQVKCPNPDTLKKNISQRNKISNQINQIFVLIISNAALAYVFQQLSLLFKNVELQVSNIPLPLSTPPGVGVPYSVVSQIQGVEDLLKGLEKQSKESYKSLIISLLFLLAALILIILLLSKIDKSIQECVQQNQLEDEPLNLVPINEQLSNIAESQSLEEDQQNRTKDVNGFKIEVININEDLPKKQAIAKNSQGVIVLKGESSYSAGGEVLIQELEYYIKSNNLKAY